MHLKNQRLKKQASLFLGTATVLLLAGCGPESPQQKLVDRQINEVILPIHHDFAEQSEKFNQQAINFCASPSNPALFSPLQQQWKTTMDSWQRVKVFNFGPIEEQNLAWRVQFWPDNKNLVKQKTLNLLKSDKPINVALLEESTVVIQGLSASEYLLFDRQKVTPATASVQTLFNQPMGERRCDMLMAVTQNSANIATRLDSLWATDTDQPSYASVMRGNDPFNLSYPTANVAIATIVESMINSLDAMKNDQLAKPLGFTSKNKQPRPYLVQAWRSQTSLALVGDNLQVIDKILSTGLLDYLATKEGGKALAEQIRQQIQATQETQASINEPLFTALSDDAQREKVVLLLQQSSQLLRLLKHDMLTVLKITLGFNSNDGD